MLATLRASGAGSRTLVLLTSDHGESLGEHDYCLDHGGHPFDPTVRTPLVLSVPGGPRGAHVADFSSTLDVVPTILDAVRVSYPPDLSGKSLLPVAERKPGPGHERLFAENDRGLSASWDARYKVVAKERPKHRPRLSPEACENLKAPGT